MKKIIKTLMKTYKNKTKMNKNKTMNLIKIIKQIKNNKNKI